MKDHKISIFENATSPKQSTLTVQEYFKGIISGKWQDEVLQYRAGKRDKQKIHAVTASGLFLGRKDSDLSEHSGLLVIDVDEKDQTQPTKVITQSLKEIPEVFAIHTSLGGKGLAVYFKINKVKHFESFEAITKVLINDYSIIPDMHCSNIGRLRFISYDPDCHLNFGATIWKYFEKKEQRATVNEKQYNYHVYSENDIDFIINQIKERQINIATDYYSWLRISFGLASKLGESGRDYFKIISQYYYGKQKINPDKQYDNCLKADNGKSSGSSIKSFFYYAKLAGCDLVSDRTSKIKTVAKIRRKQEQSSGSGSMVNGKADAIKYLDEFEGITGSDVDDILKQIWDMPAKELASEEGLLYDIEIFLKSNYKFRYNEITGIVEVDGEMMNDYVLNSIYLKSIKVVSEKSNKDKVFDLINSDFTPKYNPIFEWIEKNKHIKTTGNVTKLAECINSSLNFKDSQFVEYYLEKWLISIIASAHGIYSILCLVLTGQEQGTGKTNFFRELLPEELRWLFAINKLDMKNEADIGQLMCCKLLILDDEFGGKSKSDEKRFKEMISKDKFTIRKPWGRYFEDIQRLAVLCGTTNEEHVINDLTGNRRIIPIQVDSIDLAKFAKIDKTELFIELYWKFRDNQKGWFLNKEDIVRLNEVCFDANQVAPEMELPLKYFTKAEEGDSFAKFYSSSEIRSGIEQKSGIRLSQQKLSIALKNLGYVKAQKRIDGNNTRGFWVHEVRIEEYGRETAPEPVDTDELPF
jgi:predicted P-loop ATPase